MTREIVLQVVPLAFPWASADPFLFCVHHVDGYPAGNEQLGPAASLAGRRIGMDFDAKDGWNMYHGDVVPGFPQHPHRGFETVTIARRGLIDHSDSLGAAARFGRGDVQWLTAGAGIVHSEMFPLLDREAPNPVELFQIWLNLPAADKMAEPHFTMIWGEDIPRIVQGEAGRGAEITVVAGKFGDAAPPSPPPRSYASRPDSDVAIWTVRIDPGAKATLPAAAAGTNRVLYFFAGSELKIAGTVAKPRHAHVVRPDAELVLEAGAEEVELLVLQGRPIGEPVAQHGPFVMNQQSELRQAFEDYHRTKFGGWPWPSDGPVHGATEGRYARHADGRVERR